jgi:hypothetical protein
MHTIKYICRLATHLELAFQNVEPEFECQNALCYSEGRVSSEFTESSIEWKKYGCEGGSERV